MKKILVLASALCIAAATQAASVSWAVTKATDFKSGTVYVVTGLTSAEVIALCESTDASDWATAFSGATSGSVANRGGANGVSSDVGDAVVFAFVSPAGIAEGSSWAVSDNISTTGYTYTPPATKPADLTYEYAAANVTSGTFQSQSIPEPTTVALLALGLAAVGLKRKVA